MFNTFFFENCAVYEIMWKNIVQPGRRKMTIWRVRVACWLPKATHTHTIPHHAQNMQYLLLFHCNNGNTNAPHIVLCLCRRVVYVTLNKQRRWSH